MEVINVFLLAAELSLIFALSLGEQCPAQRETAAKFTLTSRRNQTGHWIAKVTLERGTRDKNDATLWTVEVEQNTAQCAGLDSVKVTASIVAPPPRAGQGYALYPGIGYYKLHDVPKTWQEARDICEQEGGHLAIINSEAESSVLKKMFAPVAEKLKATWAFVGFHDLYQEGTYVTIFDEPLNSTGFTRWSSANQPDNSGGNGTMPGEDCGSMHTNGGINDLSCTKKVPFFCEQELWLTPKIEFNESSGCSSTTEPFLEVPAV